jgi:hypothetical protein
MSIGCLPFVAMIFVMPGVLMLLVSEIRAAHTAQGLSEGQAVVTPLPGTDVDPENEGKLVHLTGEVTASEVLTDPEFAVSMPVIRLERHVSLYQWNRGHRDGHPHRRPEPILDGGSICFNDMVVDGRYTYYKEWSEKVIGEPTQQVKGGVIRWNPNCPNPKQKPFENKSVSASDIRLGGFVPAKTLVDLIKADQPLELDAAAFDQVPEKARGRLSFVRNGVFFCGNDPATPEVGDARIEFRVARPRTVSVVARQVGDTLQPYTTEAGTTICSLSPGTVSAADMLEGAAFGNLVFTWFIRVFSIGMMGFGFVVCFWMLAMARLPGLREISFFGAVWYAFLMTGAVAAGIIAMNWAWQSPYMSLILLVVASSALADLWFRSRRSVPHLSEPERALARPTV